MIRNVDVIILGAGAAGMMCAAEAARRGRTVAVIDHAEAPGEKIRISGGGRCNFTNLHCSPANFLSANGHFCKSALARFTQHDFIKRVEARGIAYHEKTLGQLFCDDSARAIIAMLLDDMARHGADLHLETAIRHVRFADGVYSVETAGPVFTAPALVVATGGLSIPKMGATGIGYDIARQFNIPVTETRAGLVPLTFDAALLARTKALAGVAVDPAVVSCGKAAFREALLFTHRGLSGPSILQISSYWRAGDSITVDLLPDGNVFEALRQLRQEKNKSLLHNALATLLPKRLAEMIVAESGPDLPLPDVADARLRDIHARVHQWQVTPVGSEGYRTAEVTLGGVDTAALSSKTMEAKNQPGLYFIGEVVDVTGHLGGHNFQWAWASGFACGQSV
jgi:predicted Rossmann fold flavoprotein